MFNALIQAARATKLEKVTSLSEAYRPGKPFNVFINPVSSDDIGTVVKITATPDRNDSAVEVPVVAGDWSPIIFKEISASGVDLSGYELYVGLIDVD